MDEHRHIEIKVAEPTVPTTASAFHPDATHVDALGMPVAFVWSQHDENPHSYHPTPCCGAAASINDGPMYCKRCYEEVDPAFGNVPLEPLTALEGRAIPDRPAPAVMVEIARAEHTPLKDLGDGRMQLIDSIDTRIGRTLIQLGLGHSSRVVDGTTVYQIDSRYADQARAALRAERLID